MAYADPEVGRAAGRERFRRRVERKRCERPTYPYI